MNKLFKIFTISSTALLSIVSLTQATPTLADTVTDPLVSSSTGTLNITDGAVKLSQISDLNFGDVPYTNSTIHQPLSKNAANNKDAKVVINDTTAAQKGWAITAHTEDDTATLTINGKTISPKTDVTVFDKATDVQDAPYGDQTIAINPETTSIDLTNTQARASVLKRAGKIKVGVTWTLSPVTTKAANFNS
ncbi:WxL domain-containing protein [Latilactobacillus fragifolii]|uniref:WxL domain-containing protein n=1 Tax=Latilactobacillus fragifolii TaxID=2814244 RepID=UPI001ABB6506|nr:WxL domain-containing protein [Latilactobacillus fragifolii]